MSGHLATRVAPPGDRGQNPSPPPPARSTTSPRRPPRPPPGNARDAGEGGGGDPLPLGLLRTGRKENRRAGVRGSSPAVLGLYPCPAVAAPAPPPSLLASPIDVALSPLTLGRIQIPARTSDPPRAGTPPHEPSDPFTPSHRLSYFHRRRPPVRTQLPLLLSPSRSCSLLAHPAADAPLCPSQHARRASSSSVAWRHRPLAVRLDFVIGCGSGVTRILFFYT